MQGHFFQVGGEQLCNRFHFIRLFRLLLQQARVNQQSAHQVVQLMTDAAGDDAQCGLLLGPQQLFVSLFQFCDVFVHQGDRLDVSMFIEYGRG